MYSHSGMPPLTEVRPFRYANAGAFGDVGDTRLSLVPQARAHSRRNLARAGVIGSAAQRVEKVSACAGADESSAPDAMMARQASLRLMLDCMGCCLYCSSVVC